MVLRACHRQNILAIYHGDKAGFLANEEILDHHAVAGVAILVPLKHVFDGRDGLRFSFCNNHAFACCQSVCLDHDRRAARLYIGDGRGSVSEGFKGCGRNAVAFQEIFTKSLGAFQLRGGPRRAKTGQSLLLKKINDTLHQWSLRSHNGQGYLILFGKLRQSGEVEHI